MSEQLYFGGDIYTVDDARPTVDAVAVRDGWIVAVGSPAECRSILRHDHEAIDLRGATLLPSFIDTHFHPLMTIYYAINVNLRGMSSLADLQNTLREMARHRPPEDWIVGLDFDEQNLAEARLPTRRDLDVACPDRPVVLIKHDGHMTIANTRAIESSGAARHSSDPEGGAIDREPDGYPAGPFRETASSILRSAIPVPSLDALAAGAKAVAATLLSQGVTSIGGIMQTDEEGPAGDGGALEVMMMSMFAKEFPLDIYGIVFARGIESVEGARRAPLHHNDPGASRIGAIKIIADGSFGSCTALMFEPFTDQPDKRGFLLFSADEIYRRMAFAHRAGLQIVCHAIGDAANRTVIDLYARLLAEYPRADHRHRIEHASVLDAGMIADMARLGLIASVTPLYVHTEKSWLLKRLGPARARWTYPFRALLDGGVKVAGASDAPVESSDVLHAIQCCVTRDGFEPRQRITAAEAIRLYTIDAAYAHFEEQVKGSIATGKRADLVVLSANPTRVPPEAIARIQVRRTIMKGKTLYQAD